MSDKEIKYYDNLKVSSSPHLVTSLDTQKTMTYVLIALLPSVIASVIFFGFHALLVEIVTVAAAVFFEWGYNKLMKKPQTIQDRSAMVTGLILALNLPANFPVWMAIIGAFVAIVIVKCLYGGIGRNIANPALVGRIVLLISFTSYMSGSVWPYTRFQIASGAVDGLTGATPLGLRADGLAEQFPSLGDMFIGNIGGAMGETCALAILIGGLFLIWKKIISPIIPVFYIGTVFVFALIYYGVTGGMGDYNAFEMAVFHIFAGGCMFGAFFCATDYVTSPIMKRGKMIYGIGCGAFTMIIRLFCSYPEGASFAILFMNILTPLIDMYTENQFYGITARKKAEKKAAKEAAKAPAEEKKEGAKA